MPSWPEVRLCFHILEHPGHLCMTLLDGDFFFQNSCLSALVFLTSLLKRTRRLLSDRLEETSDIK